jgi:hypothetical protein
MAEDCYFFVRMDDEIPDHDKKLSILCMPCRAQHYPNIGWFWKGSVDGYGPYKYICCECGKDVSKGDYGQAQTAD